MTNKPDPNVAPNLFGQISEQDRRAALDAIGKWLVGARDLAVLQWDQILQGKRSYAPWERLLIKFPELDPTCREVVRESVPNIVDTLMYCLLAGLDASENIQVSALLGHLKVDDVARMSWGLAAEPAGENGWLARFSTQRFEQPY